MEYKNLCLLILVFAVVYVQAGVSKRDIESTPDESQEIAEDILKFVGCVSEGLSIPGKLMNMSSVQILNSLCFARTMIEENDQPTIPSNLYLKIGLNLVCGLLLHGEKKVD